MFALQGSFLGCFYICTCREWMLLMHLILHSCTGVEVSMHICSQASTALELVFHTSQEPAEAC